MTAFIAIDRDAFKKDVEQLLHGTKLWADIQGGISIDLFNPDPTKASLGDLVQHVIAAVEVAKANDVAMAASDDPPGSIPKPFSGEVAAEVAVMVLHDAVQVNYTGRWRWLFNLISSPITLGIFKFAVESGIAAYKTKDWLTIAKGILGVVAAVV